jgi:hypothetical protein
LEHEKKELLKKLGRLHALAILSSHFDETRKVMDKAATKADAVEALFSLATTWVKEVLFSEEDIEHVLDGPLWSLAKVSREKVQGDIDRLNGEIVVIDGKLQNVKEVVRQSLTELKVKFNDKRGTSLTAREQVIENNTTYVMGVRSDGTISRDFDNRAKNYFDFALTCKDGIFVVRDKTHKATIHVCAYTPQLDLGAGVVGVFKSDDLYFAAIFEDGNGVWCQPGSTDFFVSKTDTPIVSVAGVGEGESIAFIREDGTFLLYDSETFNPENAMRRGSKPQKIDGFETAKGSTSQVLRVPAGCELIHNTGRFFVVGEKNYVLWKDGKKSFSSRKDVLDGLTLVEKTQPL